MAIHDREELDREDGLVRAYTSGSLMSDTKWRKLFVALSEPKLNIVQCIFKFVGSGVEYVDDFPPGLHPPKPWFDDMRFGPTPFRSVEWVLFPRIAKHEGHPTRFSPQDVNAAAEAISCLGQFPIELSERGLLVRGYIASAPSPTKPYTDHIR